MIDSYPSPAVLAALRTVGERGRILAQRASADPLRTSGVSVDPSPATAARLVRNREVAERLAPHAEEGTHSTDGPAWCDQCDRLRDFGSELYRGLFDR